VFPDFQPFPSTIQAVLLPRKEAGFMCAKMQTGVVLTGFGFEQKTNLSGIRDVVAAKNAAERLSREAFSRVVPMRLFRFSKKNIDYQEYCFVLV
jgi:hypothetical protein